MPDRCPARVAKEAVRRGPRGTERKPLVVGDQLGKFVGRATTGTRGVEETLSRVGEIGGSTRSAAWPIQRPGDPKSGRWPSTPASVAGASESPGSGGVEQVLQDTDQLDGQDRELLSQPQQQWPHRRIQSWTALDPVASIRHDKL